jgi:hypothetical protein
MAIRVTRRKDELLTIGGLTQDQFDMIVGALVTNKISYRNAPAPDAGMRARFDERADQLLVIVDALASKVSPSESHVLA